MHNYKKGAALAAQGFLYAKNSLAVAVIAATGLVWMEPSHAFRFGSEDGISGSLDSNLGVGFAQRLDSPDCHILGGDSGGCNNSINTGLSQFYNLDKGNGYANADIVYRRVGRES